MEYRVTGWDTRWDMGHWDGMGGAGMEQEPLGKDMRQDRRSQEGTGGHGAPGRDRRPWDGAQSDTGMGQEPLGWDRRCQEGT